MPAPTRRRLLLIDGSSQMYRAYHAIRGLTGPDGKSTNAVYGFVAMLRKLLTEQQPEYIAAAFDVRGPTFRDALDADYKANRAPMPDDLVEQVPWVHEACDAMGVPVLTAQGYEADDVIGTLTRRAAAEAIDVVIVTGDKDFFQLVDDGVRVYNPKDDGTWYDAEGVKQKFGVRPNQVVDVLALMGDAVDNVKGVPGIGEKGARALIGEHETLDALLANADQLTKRSHRTALTEHADSALRSRELVRIHTDVSVELDLGRFLFTGPTPERCFALFSKLEFPYVARRLRADRRNDAGRLSGRPHRGGSRAVGARRRASRPRRPVSRDRRLGPDARGFGRHRGGGRATDGALRTARTYVARRPGRVRSGRSARGAPADP